MPVKKNEVLDFQKEVDQLVENAKIALKEYVLRKMSGL